MIYYHNLIVLCIFYLNSIPFIIITILVIFILIFLLIIMQIIMLINPPIILNSYYHNLYIFYLSLMWLLSPHHLKFEIIILKLITIFEPIPLSSYQDLGLIIPFQVFWVPKHLTIFYTLLSKGQKFQINNSVFIFLHQPYHV